MRENFASSLAAVLQHEGGKVDDPRDPGGRTAYGVTQRTYDDWRRSQGLNPKDVWGIAQNEVAAIYKRSYWDRCRCDDLPAGVDYAVFDFAVNSGTVRAARYLQRAAGVAEDGQIGPVTIAAVAATPPCSIINEVCGARLAFLAQLPTFDRFGRGWTTRVGEVGRAAAGMAA